jgi:hypothetical protein
VNALLKKNSVFTYHLFQPPTSEKLESIELVGVTNAPDQNLFHSFWHRTQDCISFITNPHPENRFIASERLLQIGKPLQPPEYLSLLLLFSPL